MRDKPRILLFTGEGKGKTTAALGMVLRASGHGLRILVLQFIKSEKGTGEMFAARRLPDVEIVPTGKGFVPAPDAPSFAGHREAAQRGLDRAGRALEEGRYDMVVLDEICTAVSRGLLDEKAVLDAIGRASAEVCIVMTGRGATAGLMACADTVTEMALVKHGYHEGYRAQKGVEY